MARSALRTQHRRLDSPHFAGRLDWQAMDTLDRGELDAPTGIRAPWWRQGQRAVWAASWPGLVATLLVATLLVAYVQVVLASVQKSEGRNRAVAAHADALWRCNALRAASQRASCRVQLDAGPPASPAP